jgi:hypothetical protein
VGEQSPEVFEETISVDCGVINNVVSGIAES